MSTMMDMLLPMQEPRDSVDSDNFMSIMRVRYIFLSLITE